MHESEVKDSVVGHARPGDHQAETCEADHAEDRVGHPRKNEFGGNDDELDESQHRVAAREEDEGRQKIIEAANDDSSQHHGRPSRFPHRSNRTNWV